MTTLTDEELFNLCQKYGHQAKLWKQKFAGLLPEVFKRKLYEKKGFSSIFEFAGKLAGMSKEHVKRVLSLNDNFQDKPILKNMLQNGEVSIHKLSRIASIATHENQDFLANQVKLLSKSALETLARDVKSLQIVPGHKTELNNQTEIMQVVHELNLSDEVKQKLYELQRKGIDINKLLLEFLNQREKQILEQKERIASSLTTTNSRYIPVKIKNLLIQEYGTI